jgi:hypothetical protein
MKLRILLCALISISSSSVYSEEAELQEASKPTWLERLFGAKEQGDKNEAIESSDESVEQAKAEKKKAKAEHATKEEKFSDEEREVLAGWQNGNASWKKSNKPLAPGLKKKLERGGELPAGWEKKLAVGQVLEPDLDAQSESLPEETLKRLPKTEAGTEILRVGDEIISVIEHSREILDILSRRGE